MRKALILSLTIGVSYQQLMPYELTQPPGYPPAEEYSICDNAPGELSFVDYLICAEINNW